MPGQTLNCTGYFHAGPNTTGLGLRGHAGMRTPPPAVRPDQGCASHAPRHVRGTGDLVDPAGPA